VAARKGKRQAVVGRHALGDGAHRGAPPSLAGALGASGAVWAPVYGVAGSGIAPVGPLAPEVPEVPASLPPDDFE
jgi:hypothetical protein